MAGSRALPLGLGFRPPAEIEPTTITCPPFPACPPAAAPRKEGKGGRDPWGLGVRLRGGAAAEGQALGPAPTADPVPAEPAYRGESFARRGAEAAVGTGLIVLPMQF